MTLKTLEPFSLPSIHGIMGRLEAKRSGSHFVASCQQHHGEDGDRLHWLGDTRAGYSSLRSAIRFARRGGVVLRHSPGMPRLRTKEHAPSTSPCRHVGPSISRWLLPHRHRGRTTCARVPSQGVFRPLYGRHNVHTVLSKGSQGRLRRPQRQDVLPIVQDFGDDAAPSSGVGELPCHPQQAESR